MKRKFLEDLGIDKEVIDKILDENSTDIGRAKGELDTAKSNLSEAQRELETAKKTIKERDKQLEEVKESSGNKEELEKKIDELQKANKEKDSEMQAELAKIKRDGIDELLLSEAGAKNLKMAKAILEPIEEPDEEKYKAARAEQIKAVTESEDTKFLFEIAKSTLAGTKPGEGDQTLNDKPDFSNMTYDQLDQYLKENPDATLE